MLGELRESCFCNQVKLRKYFDNNPLILPPESICQVHSILKNLYYRICSKLKNQYYRIYSKHISRYSSLCLRLRNTDFCVF